MVSVCEINALMSKSLNLKVKETTPMATQNLLTMHFMIEFKSSPTSSQPLAVLNIAYDADATATLSSSTQY